MDGLQCLNSSNSKLGNRQIEDSGPRIRDPIGLRKRRFRVIQVFTEIHMYLHLTPHLYWFPTLFSLCPGVWPNLCLVTTLPSVFPPEPTGPTVSKVDSSSLSIPHYSCFVYIFREENLPHNSSICGSLTIEPRLKPMFTTVSDMSFCRENGSPGPVSPSIWNNGLTRALVLRWPSRPGRVVTS